MERMTRANIAESRIGRDNMDKENVYEVLVHPFQLSILPHTSNGFFSERNALMIYNLIYLIHFK